MLARNKNPFVNIIMPVFNSRDYLSGAVDSILLQSYRNIKLFLIDDGSSDGSSAVCDDYAQKDARVRVIHQENHGLCHARNRGIELIREGYIAFADHDDIYLDGSIEKLAKIACDESVDLIKGTYIGEIQNFDGQSRVYEARMEDATLTLSELADNYRLFNYSIRAMWNGMYKADIIHTNHIRFDETLKAGAEDYSFNLEYLKYAKKILLTDYPLYKHYARANQSASVGYNENRQKGIVNDYHKESNLLKKLDISKETYIHHQLWYFYMLVREYCFDDTPLNEKEIIDRLNVFLDGMENFQNVTLKDQFLLFQKEPKGLVKWELLNRKKAGLLYKLFRIKHG